MKNFVMVFTILIVVLVIGVLIGMTILPNLRPAENETVQPDVTYETDANGNVTNITVNNEYNEYYENNQYNENNEYNEDNQYNENNEYNEDNQYNENNEYNVDNQYNENSGTSSETPAHTHSFSSWQTLKAATCTESGLMTRTCSGCGHTESSTIEAGSHVIVVDAHVEATCTSNGLTEGSHCSACGTVFAKQETIWSPGHTEVTIPGKEATCGEDGLTEGINCSTCGTVIKSQRTISATGKHTYDYSRMCCTGCGKELEGTSGLKYRLSDDGTYYTCLGSKSYIYPALSILVIPAEYNGKPVKEIACDEIFPRWDAKIVIICDGIERIDCAFFDCNAIEEVYIPDSVRFIDQGSFKECELLEKVYINTSGWEEIKYKNGSNSIISVTSIDFSDPYKTAKIFREGGGYIYWER